MTSEVFTMHKKFLSFGFIIQLVIQYFGNVTSREINLSRHAVWNQNAVTVAGWQNGTNGSSPSQLSHPTGISISLNDMLYISDCGNRRAVAVDLNSDSTSYTIGSGPGSDLTSFTYPHSLFASNTSLYVADSDNRRVQKLSLNGSNPATVLQANTSYRPTYLYVTDDDDIYVSDTHQHRVLRYNSKLTNETVVAGTGINGTNDTQLDRPYGIFVGRGRTLYVADCYNHRIMKWLSGGRSGVRVAGSGVAGTSPAQLHLPTHIIVDRNEYMYISEGGNGRITRWTPNSTFGVCIAACTGLLALASNQLRGPHSLAFDTNGSLYVSDHGNHRVQKFQIQDYHIPYNQPKINANATWDTCGITIANETITGENTRQFLIDSNDTIYMGNHVTNRIFVFKNGVIIMKRNLDVSLFVYTALFATSNGDIYFENRNETGRIEKWSADSVSTAFVARFTGNCYGLFIDIYNNLYCSVRYSSQVERVSLYDTNLTPFVVAKGLGEPWGIFVDKNSDLYVAAVGDNRVQLFRPGQTEGITVAGNGTPNNLTLQYPTDVITDAEGFLYITDNNNHRIIRTDSNNYKCIIGCIGHSGSASDELNKPYVIRFDSVGDLYVADEFNNRIQKFTLAHNSCVEASTTPVPATEHQTNASPTFTEERTERTTALSTVQLTPTPLPFYFSPKCQNATYIGHKCNISGAICDLLRPCQHQGQCTSAKNNNDYNCSCKPGFHGPKCEYDHSTCNDTACSLRGNCRNESDGTFKCHCKRGWEGRYCETMVNFCRNITCQNNAVCRPLFRDYKCQCLTESYSGRHCEIKSTGLVIRQVVARSLGYVAILAMVCVAMFVVIMDILKYCFGIDPVAEDREYLRRQKEEKKRKLLLKRPLMSMRHQKRKK